MKYFLCICLLFMPLLSSAKDEAKDIFDCERAKSLEADLFARNEMPPNNEAKRIACMIPEDLQEQIALASWFGQAIYEHDSAAWLTSDALVAKGMLKNFQDVGRGWLTSDDGHGNIIVRYFTEADGMYFAMAQAMMRLKDYHVIDAHMLDPIQKASNKEISQLTAKFTALSKPLLKCTEGSFNTVIFDYSDDLQPEIKERIRVYLLSPFTSNDIPGGGHHRLDITKDGKEILSEFNQTKNCFNFKIDEKKDSLAYLSISSLTSDTPTEIHVFLSKSVRKPLFVKTKKNGMFWVVDGTRIDLVKREDGKPLDASSTLAPMSGP